MSVTPILLCHSVYLPCTWSLQGVPKQLKYFVQKKNMFSCFVSIFVGFSSFLPAGPLYIQHVSPIVCESFPAEDSVVNKASV